MLFVLIKSIPIISMLMPNRPSRPSLDSLADTFAGWVFADGKLNFLNNDLIKMKQVTI